MTYETEIPDFALVPARQPEERVLIPITQGAVYSSVQVTNITEKPKTIITIEEDILVPDTRPDLREILDISGRVRLTSREIDQLARKEDAIPLTGDIELQVLYIPEKVQVCGPVIAVTNRIPFRESWHTDMASGASVMLDAQIENIDCMVINERKFRVKIMLSIHARECQDSKIDMFEGITGEDIQTLRETVEMTNIALRKKDITSIRETLEQKDGDPAPETILRQDITVVENYKQATAEKVVINGFIYVNLLYASACHPGTAEPQPYEEEESGMRISDMIHQFQSRLEFTQFIPLSQSSQWSGSNVIFDGSDLRVKIAEDEEGCEIFRLEGDIVTWIELYRNVEKEIIVDGYHREKDFVCDFEEAACRSLVGTSTGESTLREIIPMESPHGELEQILFACGEIASAQSHAEAGKVITEGVLRGKILCLGASDEAEQCLFAVQQEIPFRCITAAPQLTGSEAVSHKISIKDLWADKINSKQAELNGTVLVSVEMMRQAPFKVLKNPAFEEVQGGGGSQRPMAVYITREGDSLWSVAKKFKSTVDSIMQVNQLEDGALSAGQKLLILR